MASWFHRVSPNAPRLMPSAMSSPPQPLGKVTSTWMFPQVRSKNAKSHLGCVKVRGNPRCVPPSFLTAITYHYHFFSHSSTTWTRSLQQQYSNRAGKKRTFLPAQGMGESRVTNWNLPSSWTHTLTNTELESLVERPPTGTHPEHQAQRVGTFL